MTAESDCFVRLTFIKYLLLVYVGNMSGQVYELSGGKFDLTGDIIHQLENVSGAWEYEL